MSVPYTFGTNTYAQSGQLDANFAATVGTSGGTMTGPLIGTTATFSGAVNAGDLIISKGTDAGVGFTDRTTTTNTWLWYSTGNSAKLHSWNGQDQWSIDGGGNLTLNNGASIEPATDNTGNCGAPGNSWFQVAAHNLVNTSDPRLKENMEPAPPGVLSLIEKIGVHHYTSKGYEDKPRIGFDASEVLKVHPRGAVVGEDEDKTLGVNVTDMLATLWQGVQELSAKVEALEKGR